MNCNTEWQSAIDIHHRSNQSGLGRYNRYTYLSDTLHTIIYTVRDHTPVQTSQLIRLTGNNSPRRDMCYTHNHDVRQGTTLPHTKTCMHGCTNIHIQRLYLATLSCVCVCMQALYMYMYIYIYRYNHEHIDLDVCSVM